MSDNISLEVCTECVMAIAYGTDSIDDLPAERAAEINAGLDSLAAEGYVVVNGTGEDTEGFSTSRCDLCGTTLAGAREAAVAVAQ